MTIQVFKDLDSALGETQVGSRNTIDLSVFFCGFESRCSFFYASITERSSLSLIVDFGSTGVGSYDENIAFYKDQVGERAEIIPDSKDSSAFRRELNRRLEGVCKDFGPGREIILAIDISSANRRQQAIFFELAWFYKSKGSAIKVIVSYVFAKYTPPSRELLHAVHFGPVTPFFAGWDCDPTVPVALILGLGYEKDRALSTVEFLEPRQVYVLAPCNGSGGYDQDIAGQVDLLREAGIPINEPYFYDVLSFESLCWHLDLIVSGLLGKYRVVIVPGGPKLFNLASILVSIRYRSRLHLYRVSGGTIETPVNREPDTQRAMFTSIAL